MKIKFVQRPTGGRDYKAGDEVEFTGRVEEGYAQKYVDRGWAMDISPKVSEAAAEGIAADEAATAATEEAAVLQAEADRLAGRRAIEIPNNWQDLPWPAMRSLAAELTDDPVRSKDDAETAIRAEMAKRSPA